MVRRTQVRLDWIVIGMLLVAFALRVAGLEKLPIFYDETLYLRWAERTHDRLDFGYALREVSTLQVWLLALFYDISPSTIWMGRFVSAMVGVLTVGVCYAIGRQLYPGRGAARLAALLYTVVPFAVFHDRLAQNDGLLAGLLAVAVYLSLRLARQPRRWGLVALLLVLTFGLALLAKRSGALFIATPLLALLASREYGRRGWLAVAVALAGMIAMTLFIGWISAGTGDQLINQLASFNPAVYGPQLRQNLSELAEWFYRYLMVPALVLLTLAIASNLKPPRRRADLLLLALAFIPLIFFTLLSRRWYPRYLLPSIFPLLVLLAGQVVFRSQQIARRRPVQAAAAVGLTAQAVGPGSAWGRWPDAQVVGGLLTLALILPMLWFDLALIADPVRTPLPGEDRRQYISGMPAGYGLPAVAAFLIELADRGEPLSLWRNDRSIPPRYGLAHYLPDHDMITRKSFDTNEKSWAEIEADFDQAAADRLTYLVLNIPYEKGVPNLVEVPQLVRVKRFAKPDEVTFIDLYRWLSRAEYGLLTANIPPGARVGLTPALADQPLPTAAERFDLVEFDLALNQATAAAQPFDYLLLDRAWLQTAGLLDEAGRLTHLPDPSWSLDFNDRACSLCLFRLWPATLPQPAATFEQDPEFLATMIPAGPWSATEPLRVTLYWQTARPELDPDLAAFIHVVDSQGQLVTQQDTTWLDGQFPASEHRPTDILSQRFELDLATASGQVCLLTGLYRRSSGERLPAVQGNQQPLPDNALPLGCNQVQP